MLARLGLAASGVHIPVSLADIEAVPPGKTTQLTVWSTPALGLAVTVTVAVSVQPTGLVHMNEYTPCALNEVIVVLAEEGEVIVAVPGLPV